MGGIMFKCSENSLYFEKQSIIEWLLGYKNSPVGEAGAQKN